MSVEYTEDLFKKLPVWARSVIAEQKRTIVRQDRLIDLLKMESVKDSNTRIVNVGSEDVLLQNNARVRFSLPNAIMCNTTGHQYVRECEIEVSVKGKHVEIYSNEGLLIRSHASNICYIENANTLEGDFVRLSGGE